MYKLWSTVLVLGIILPLAMWGCSTQTDMEKIEETVQSYELPAPAPIDPDPDDADPDPVL